MKPSRRQPGAGLDAARDRTEGELIYAFGDVHGRYDLLKALLRRAADDWAGRAGARRPVLVFCGDYVDRGRQSAQVVETLVWLQRRPDIEVHALKGNHEQALMQFLDAPEDAADWLAYGGAETLLSYGAPPHRAMDAAGRRAARDALLERMPSSHLRFLERLELMLTIGDYAFVHAGVRPDAPLGAQTEDDLLWIREPFLAHPGPFEKVVVHGHTWIDDEPQALGHRIGLDTGAYATGVLTAVRLQEDQAAFLQVRGTGGEAAWPEGPAVDRPLHHPA